MGIDTRLIEYRDGDVLLESYMSWDDSGSDSRPGVLIAHAWGGRGDHEQHRAEQLAELGYVGFALDMFGKGVRGSSKEENAALIQPFLNDRAMLQRRMKLALDVMCKQKEVDSSRAAAMGFCFGGLCVLDLARTGVNISGVASFHGLFGRPGNTAGNQIAAKVLVLHGWEDPMATPDQVLGLAEEMTSKGADWQIHAYGNTMHAFTNPVANDPDFGTVYDAAADHRSWQNLQLFLAEIF